MALLSRLFTGDEKRTPPSGPLSSSNDWDLRPGRTDAGRDVTERDALQVAAVWRAVNLIAGTSSSLPIKSYQDGTRERVPSVIDDPHPDLTPYELFETLWFSLLLWGNSYQQKIRNRAGEVVELWPLLSSQMQVGRVTPSEDFPTGKLFKLLDANGKTHVLSSIDVFHVPGPGYDGITGVSPIRMASQGIGMALAAEEYGARLFGSGSMMAGILQTEQRLDDEQAKSLKERWAANVAGLRKSHEIAVLGSGAKFQPVTMPNKDAQFLESRKFQVTEIARWFGIPPHLLFDVEKTTSWGSGIEHQSIGFVVYTLRPWLSRLEQRITKELNPAGTYAEFNVEGLLRGDSNARANFYRTMVEIRAMNPNEVRGKENLEPYDGGEVFANPNITTGETLGELDGTQMRAVMGRLSRPESLDDIDPQALVADLNGTGPVVLGLLQEAIDAGDDVAGFRERLRALGPKENA